MKSGSKPLSAAAHTAKRILPSLGAALTTVAVTVGGIAAGSAVHAPAQNLDMEGVCTMSGGTIDGKPPANKDGSPKTDEINFNRLKNRYDLPGEEDFVDGSALADGSGDSDKTWANLFDPSKFPLAKHKTLQDQPALEKHAMGLSGYIFEVNPGTAESCNCTQPEPHRDVHIYLSPTKITAATGLKDCIVVEITPRMRHLLGHDSDWNASEIMKDYGSTPSKERLVNVEGWLFYDYEHVPNAILEQASATSKKWRKSCWEIHPVTSLALATPGH